ncbi:MAG TPA: glycosyltransferase [Bacteroidales bacterium]|nr:glycosyltransferase [Bacteroidales bacterium]HSA44150.1 glycosyltransferase [Bacteroidales bacterium]
MIRVLRIINRFNLGGPTYNAVNLTRYLPGDFETLLYGGMHEAGEASSCYIAEQAGVEYHILNRMHRAIRPLDDSLSYLEIARIIRDFRPHIVHTHASKAGALGRAAAIRARVPVIVHTFHGHVLDSYFSPLKNRIFTGIERSLARRTDSIIALSEKQKNDLTQLLGPDKARKIAVIPLGFDLDKFLAPQQEKRRQFRERYGLDDHVVAAGIIGRLVAVKNHRLFLEAVRQASIHAKQPFHAFITGDGEEREKLEKTAEEMGILFNTSTVQRKHAILSFTSWIKEMDTVMAGLDFVALSSFNEGTPVSLIEAQAAGKAMVSTRVGGIEDIVQEGITALLSDPGDEAAFVANFIRMIDDHDLRMSFSGPAREWTQRRFSHRRLADDMAAHYMKLLQGKDIRDTEGIRT